MVKMKEADLSKLMKRIVREVRDEILGGILKDIAVNLKNLADKVTELLRLRREQREGWRSWLRFRSGLREC